MQESLSENLIGRTMTNVVFDQEYPVQYTSSMSTRVSNALLVGEVIGQIVIGYRYLRTRISNGRLTCDYLGRKC